MKKFYFLLWMIFGFGGIAQATTFTNVDSKKIPESYLFTQVKGTGERVLYVFSDIDCPYCDKLEKTLAHLDDITVHTLLLPLPSLHPDGARKSELIWCSPNPTQAWAKFFKSGKLPESKAADCHAPIAEIRALADQLGIGEEPAVLFEDGTLSSGIEFVKDTWDYAILDYLMQQRVAKD